LFLRPKNQQAGNNAAAQGASKMSETIARTPRPTRIAQGPSRKFSLDTWAVIVALALSAAVWLGLIKHIPW
jgi:hypothetical protein